MNVKTASVLVTVILVSIVACIAARFHREREGSATFKSVPQEALDLMYDIPKDVEGWELISSVDGNVGEEDEALQFDASGVADAFQRKYQNANGDVVSVYFAVGKGRHLSKHIPKRCYGATGYELIGGEKVFPIPLDPDNPEESLDTITSIYNRESKGTTSRIRIYWSFYVPKEKRWVATPSPWYYVTEPVLYKFYLISGALSKNEAPSDSPGYEFAKTYLPQLKKAIDGELKAERESKEQAEKQDA